MSPWAPASSFSRQSTRNGPKAGIPSSPPGAAAWRPGQRGSSFVDVKDQGTVDLPTLCILDPRSAWHYHYEYSWKYGLRGAVPDPDAVDRVPYGANERHVLIQGYRGTFSHQAGSINEYAYDFAMPVGTTVCAACEGVVIGERDDSDVGGASPVFRKSANYVVIRHRDGARAEYLHLKKGGVLVSLGADIDSDQPIALSGATGFTTRPHVHFAVFHLLDRSNGPDRESLPVAVSTKEGILRSLVQGSEYRGRYSRSTEWSR